jgi:hypothetical protein
MRAPVVAFVLLALLAAPALGDAPPTIELTVGEESRDLGVLPYCDDLGVVAIKANGRGVRATRAGTTICSFDASGGGGIRRVYRIVVIAPPVRGDPARRTPAEG